MRAGQLPRLVTPRFSFQPVNPNFRQIAPISSALVPTQTSCRGPQTIAWREGDTLQRLANELVSQIAIGGWTAFESFPDPSVTSGPGLAPTTRQLQNRQTLRKFQSLVGFPLTFCSNGDGDSGQHRVMSIDTAGSLIYFNPSIEPVFRKMFGLWGVKSPFDIPEYRARVEEGKRKAAAALQAERNRTQ